MSFGLTVVHTACRYYRLNGLVSPWDWRSGAGNGTWLLKTWANLII
ncbi:putative salivary gland protein 24 [Frankliniella occidentalis]|nr:putative salivary gland protein 24 [Frankliniella occidentalis]